MIALLLFLLSAHSAEPDNEPPKSSSSPAQGAPVIATVQPPELLYAPTPTYPQVALQNGISGSVLLGLDVGSTGQVVNAEILESDRDDFSEAALINARAFRFSPPLNAEGEAIEMRIQYRTVFQAEEAAPSP